MQLDKTAIAITQRNLDELLDLSLAVLRKYGLMLLKPAVLGVLPFLLLNALLLWSRTVTGNSIPEPQRWSHLQFIALMAILVYVQSPVAMSGVTMVLGNTMFGIPSTPKETLGTLRKQSLPVLWILAVLRCVFPMIAVVALLEFATFDRVFAETVGFFWVCLFALLIFAVRSFRPFAPEILLLERCPIFRKKSEPSKTQLTYGMRSSRLHGANGELFSITLFSGMVGSIFLLILNLVFSFLVGSLFGTWSWGWWMDLFFYPLSLWLVAFWGTIVRFLVYMNMRIRGEGWELELRLKAEAKRIQETEERNRG